MHYAPETPKTDHITPKQKRIKNHFSSPALLSATKKRIEEVFSSPWVSYSDALTAVLQSLKSYWACR